MVFHWSLRDSKSTSVSRTLLTILTDVYNAVVWLVFTSSLISKSSSPCSNPLATVPRTPYYKCYHHHFHVRSFFQFSSKIEVLSLFSLCFNFALWLTGTAKSIITQLSLVTALSLQITTDITVTLMLHSFYHRQFSL